MSTPAYLVTTGRRTGLPREIEIWFTECAGCFYIIAEHGPQAQWVRNIARNAQVQWRVGETRRAGRARIVEAGTEAALARSVRALFEEKYGWSEGLIVELASPTPE
jgi:deazaflavin-dependent oxidoreductase (nitroreductase family)